MNRAVALALSAASLLPLCGACELAASDPQQTCGNAVEEQPCAETSDCACGLSCVQGACAVVLNSPASAGLSPTVSESVPTSVQSVCYAIEACGIDLDTPCTEILGSAYGYAAESGCVPEMDALLSCAHQHLSASCDAITEPNASPFSAPCQQHQQQLATCFDESCVHAWTTCGHPDTESELFVESEAATCEVGKRIGCDGDEIAATCEQVAAEGGGADSGVSLWRCTCTEGHRASEVFHVYSEACCLTVDYVESACS